jgi:phosphate-selective porin OprO/OprP
MAADANRNAANALARHSDGSFTGDRSKVGTSLNLQTGYLVSKTVVVSARYTNVTSGRNSREKAAENQYTLGVSKYIAIRKLKV